MGMLRRIRCDSDYENHSAGYILQSDDLAPDFTYRQYFNVYRTRLHLLTTRIADNARKQFDETVVPSRLSDMEKGTMVLVIGVVIKRIKLKPSILRALADEQFSLPPPFIADKLVGDDDFIELEDDDQIVRLSGKIDIDDVSTGCVIGVYGMQLDDDLFNVHAIVWPTIAPQPYWPLIAHDRYIMFLSGISISGDATKDANTLLALDVLHKWLCGLLPLADRERNIVEGIVRLIVAGGSVAITDQGKQFANTARYLIKNEQCPNVECASIMDNFLSKIAKSIEVDVMPGIGDPSTHLMPQQPMHPSVFPKASEIGEMLNLVSNPYHASVFDIHLIGTSGENLTDLQRYTRKNTSGVSQLRKLLDWQHLAPTIPDTLDGFPFLDRDPLILDTLPHILFAGNQNKAEYSIAKLEDDDRKVLLLSLPAFSVKSSALLVNLRTLQVIEHIFDGYN